MILLRGSAEDLRKGWTRRDCLRVGLGSSLGLFGGRFLQNASVQGSASEKSSGFGQAKSCILIYLFGGPSHIDIWDMKPAAPAEIRGEFKPIATNVPGIQITEHLPRLAQHADQYAIIRSLAHGDSAHGSAGHTMLTGRAPRVKGEVPPNADDYPHYGSVLTRLRPAPHAVAPFVALPWAVYTSTNVVPGQNGGFLGRGADPFRLVLEVPETAINESPDPAVVILQRLVDCSVRVALDDFGSSLAPLSHLVQLPLDLLKLDTKLTLAANSASRQQVVLDSLIKLGGSVGVQVVAQGIESAEQLEVLLRMGCFAGQGPMLSGPMEAAQAFRFAETRTSTFSGRD